MATSQTTSVNAAYLSTLEFLESIPKTDLHCHLDGSIRLETLLELAEEQNLPLPATSIAELKTHVFKPHYENLEEYLECFATSLSVLRTPAALERVAYEVAVDAFRSGVRYLEIRFAPQLHATPDLSLREVLTRVNLGLRRAQSEFNNDHPHEPKYHYGIIVTAMRYFTRESSPYFASFCADHEHLGEHHMYGLASLALVKCAQALKCACVQAQTTTTATDDDHDHDHPMPIVALDLAGAERGYPARDHVDAFAFAHKNFLFKTIHAGEGFGPESIFQAITDCHAERIGHGFHLFHDNSGTSVNKYDIDDFVRYLGHRRICFEVCLSSNVQTMPHLNKSSDLIDHPVRRMLAEGLAVTLCTDNTTVSHTSMVQELALAVTSLGLTQEELKAIVMTGFKRSFMASAYVNKRRYTDEIGAYYDQVEAQYSK